MAAKAKKSGSPKKSQPAVVKHSAAANRDPKALEREISNELFTDEERARMFLAKYWKHIAVLAVLVVLAVTGGFAAYSRMEAAKKANTAKLANAKTVAEIEAVLKEIPDAPGADAARSRLAQLYVADKKYDKALAVLESLAGSTRDVACRDRARLNAAYTLELAGKTDQAAKKFAEIAGNTAVAAVIRAEAGYAAGRLYVDLNKKADAKKILASIRAIKVKPEEQQGTAMWQMRAANLEAAIN